MVQNVTGQITFSILFKLQRPDKVKSIPNECSVTRKHTGALLSVTDLYIMFHLYKSLLSFRIL